MKSEMANLKAEFDSYRSAVSSTATMHSPPTPTVTKLPLELSISENMICYNSGMCCFFFQAAVKSVDEKGGPDLVLLEINCKLTLKKMQLYLCYRLPPITYLCRYSSEHNQRAKSYLPQHLRQIFCNLFSLKNQV